MNVPEKLKINKFREVRIPKKGEYFNTGRFMTDTGIYGGEDTVELYPDTTKADAAYALMEEIERFDRQREETGE